MKKELLLATTIAGMTLGATSAGAVTASTSGHNKVGIIDVDKDSNSATTGTMDEDQQASFSVSLEETLDSGTKISTSFDIADENSNAIDPGGITLTFTDGSSLDIIEAGHAAYSYEAAVPGASGEQGITAATSVVRDSATQLTVVATLAVDGTYYIRIELNSGLAVRTTSAELTVSDAPVWTTGVGSLGTIAGDFSGTVATVAATGDTVVYSETTSVLTNASLANCSLNSSTGVITTSDFGGSSTAATTYTFTLRATDAQSQTADREFTLTSSFGATGGGQFN